MSGTGLVAEDVAAFRGERLVLRGVSLRVGPGGAAVLLGPNGAGKSTLLRVLAGLKRPDAGVVTWRGEAVGEGGVAYLGHLDAVKPGLTVRENLAFPAAAGDALDALGLRALADLPGRMLSAGQKRRVALARLAASGAGLWLLDEPTLGLDAASVAGLGLLLGAHRAAGGAVVAATHLALPLPGAQDLVLGGVRAAWALLRREVLISVRHGADTLASVLFFVLAAALFPLAIGPAPEVLARMAPGIVWVGALLAALLPLDRMFGADFEDGSLDHLLLSGLPAGVVAGVKALAHWLGTGLPLLLAAGPVAVMLQMPGALVVVLLLGLAPGTLALSLLGTLGAAVVVGARRGGVLLPLLVLPLATPVLIFGAAAVEAAGTGETARPHLLLLCAVLAGAAALCPLGAGAALRGAVE